MFIFMITMKTYQFTAQIEKDKETGLYVGIVPNLPGAHTQAATLDELQSNLKEVIELCLEELSPEELNDLSEFIGFQQISIAV
jgi:predicted RNase H-like HicB family nuclease